MGLTPRPNHLPVEIFMIFPDFLNVGGVPQVLKVAASLGVVSRVWVEFLRQGEVHDVGCGLLHSL